MEIINTQKSPKLINHIFLIGGKSLLIIFCLASFFTTALHGQGPKDPLVVLSEKIQEAKRKKDSVGYGSAYNQLTTVLSKQEGQFWKAFQQGKEAQDSIRFYLGEEHPAYANALDNLGYFYRRTGQLDAAKEVNSQNLKLYKNAKVPNNKMISRSYYLLGGVSYMEGDWLVALNLWEKSIDFWRQDGSPYYVHIASTYLQMGLTYRKTGDWEQSKSYIKTYLYYPYLNLNIRAGYEMALTFLEEKEADSAQVYLDYAFSLQDTAKLYLPHLGVEIQGRIHAMKGRNTEALLSFRESQAVRIANFSFRLRDLARGEQRIAEQFSRMSQFDSSFVYINRALSYLVLPSDAGSVSKLIYPQFVLPIFILEGEVNKQAYEESGEIPFYEKALSAYEKAYKLYLELRDDRTAESSKLLLGDYMRQMTEGVLALIHDEREANKLVEISDFDKPDQEDNILALTWMERYHAGVLFAERQKSESLLASDLPDSLRLREQGILASISFLRTEMQGESDPDSIRKKQLELIDRQEVYRLFRKDIVAEWPIYAERQALIETNDVEELVYSIGRNTSMLAYFWGKERAFVICTDRSRFGMTEIKSPEALMPAISRLKSLLEVPDNSLEKQQAFIQSNLELARSLVWDISALNENQKLLIMPDGPLAWIPFEVLCSEMGYLADDASVSTRYRNFPYLFKEKDIAYIHSLSILNSHAQKHAVRKDEVAVFAPIYEGIFALGQNEKLGQEILSQMPGIDFTASLAHKASFLNHASDFGHTHLSVHGYPDEASPWDAYLQFAPHDSLFERLYAHEIYNLNIPGSVVTLAACDGGKGRLEAGEGVISLARSFRFAGAATVIQSRWRADARVAATLFPAFYQMLSAGKSSLDAFSTTRKEFLAEASPELVHPHYWANFAHWGEDKTPRKSFWWVYLLGFAFILSSYILWKKIRHSNLNNH